MSSVTEQITILSEKVKKSNLPSDLSEKILVRLDELTKLTDSSAFLPEYDNMNRYIKWVIDLPWETKTEDNLDINHATEILNKNHYGLGEIKERILEYISVMTLAKKEGRPIRAPILCFIGLVGTGKTTFAMSIAEALGRKFARIPFGGMGDPLDLRGQSRLHAEAEPGKIIKSLKTVQSRNPVILLDEIDRVTDQGKSAIMGVLVELLDPEQNSTFVDHYIDFPFNLSEVLFVATANNTLNISTAVLDRLEPISMPSYSDNEKVMIGKAYVFPKKVREAGISPESLIIDESVWPNIVRPLGFDAGIRTLERTIEGMVRKAAKQIVEGKVQEVKITPGNIKSYLPLL